MDKETLSRALADKRFVSTYLAIVERALGSAGVRYARELLQAAEGGAGAEPAIEPRKQRAEGEAEEDYVAAQFLEACTHFGLLSASRDSELPCIQDCQAKFVACTEVCDLLDWKSRILCKLKCGLDLLLCLEDCK